MTKLEEIEKNVASLPKAEMDQFTDWFEGFRDAQWDAQLEIDSDSLNLNALADAALIAHRNGQTTLL